MLLKNIFQFVHIYVDNYLYLFYYNISSILFISYLKSSIPYSYKVFGLLVFYGYAFSINLLSYSYLS